MATGMVEGKLEMNKKPKSFQHLNPIWREKADYIIGASVPPLHKSSDDKPWEQLWARKINERNFELCCIPFFAYGLALGDEVVTNEDNMISKVSKKSGNTTMRIWFTDKITRRDIDGFCDFLFSYGYLHEWYSEHLLGINSSSLTTTEALIDNLKEYETVGKLYFEIGNPK